MNPDRSAVEQLAKVLKDNLLEVYKWGYADAEARAAARYKPLVEAAEVALHHIEELIDAWQRGRIRESDGLGGTRSNRNMDVYHAIKTSLADLKQDALERV